MRLSGVLVAVLLGSCDAQPYEIDTFPVDLDPAASIPILRAAASGIDPALEVPRVVVLDTGAPLTLLDSAEQTRSRAPLTLYAGTSGEAIPRARFLSTALLLREVSAIGPDVGGMPLYPVEGTIGGDLLGTLAIRVDLTGHQVHFFTDIATDPKRFYQEGHAVIRTNPSGGGAFELEGGVVTFPGSRLVLPTCLDQQDLGPESLDVPHEDALLVLATGFDRLVLTTTAYRRARRTVEPAYEPGFTFDTPYHVPGGTVPTMVHLDVLQRLAFADDEHDQAGACAELWLNRVMTIGTCGLACRCPDNKQVCAAGSTLELLETIPVAVIDDDDPILQAVRDELRPQYAEIDGFVGGPLLHATIFDVDYPHGHIIFRCNGPTCRTSPRFVPP